MSTKSGLERRREQIAVLTLKGATIRQMVSVLGVSKATIERDKQAIRANLGQEWTEKTTLELVGGLMAKHEMRARKLWLLIDDRNVAPSVKVAALNALREEDNIIERRAQLLGLLPKENKDMTPILSTEAKDAQYPNVYHMVVNCKKAMKQAKEEEESAAAAGRDGEAESS